MRNYEQEFTNAGFKVLQRCTLEKAPANPRERTGLVAKALNVGREQIVKALALQSGGAGSPLLLLLPADERPDMKLIGRALGQELDYFPQERLESVFGAPLEAFSLLPARGRGIPSAADGRIFDQETVVIASGDPLLELLVASDDLRAFLGGEAVRIVDLESAKQGKGGVIEPRTLKGFRDYLPEEMLPRQAMIATITQVFERFGFAPLQTPALEYSDILLGKLGRDAEKLLFRFRDNGGRDVCLRYDLTVPLARLAAQYADLPKPFKRYQIAPVWRAEKPGRGRFREFFQCDCDIVGSPSLLYDAECMALGLSVMKALGVDVQIRFNNRKVLAALAALLGIADERQMMAISRTVDKLPSQGSDRVRQLLALEASCNSRQIDQIMGFIDIAGTNGDMLKSLAQLLGEPAAQAVDELTRVLGYVENMTGNDRGAFRLDFSIARGLDYYTGTVYETFPTDIQSPSSVMSGGRYDNLIERYLGKPMPAVGISVGIDRLFSYLVELGKVQKSAVTSRVCVVAMEATCLRRTLEVLGAFRAAGVAAEMLIENEQKPKVDRQLSLAAKKGIPFAAIIGSNELTKGTVMLKNLAERRQEEITVEQAVAKLRAGP